ncbi:MAG: transglutaminase-like domain-containing protein [Verrucomicrobiales bacterium]|nr:transglutaminase-like domain-containing protein [Verrucomicrobiales bacterium]
MLAIYSVIVLLFASLCSWMLSGSPLPLALSTIVVLTGYAAKRWTRHSPAHQLIAASVVALPAGVIEWHLFRSGQAMVMSAETPAILHLGMALLWFSAVLAILSAPSQPRLIKPTQLATGLAGGAILAASASATVLYDYRAWQVFPVAVLPLTIYLKSLIITTGAKARTHLAAFAAIILVATGILSGSVAGTSYLASTFGAERDDAEDLSPQRPTDIGSSSGSMDGASRKIPREGNVTFNHQVQLFVKPHDTALLDHWSKGPLYFRTATLTRFESDEVIAPLRSGQWLYDLDDGEEDATVQLLATPPGRGYLYSVFLKQKASLSLPLAAGTRSILTSAVYEFADNWFQLSPPKEVPLFRFTAEAGIRKPSRITKFEKRLPPNSPYLSLPPSPLSAQVRKLTGSFDRGDPLNAIQNYFDRKAEYSLSFSTPEKMSPIENFIFGDHTGHCEHYGAATVLMLRTMGIPSRLAYGYTGGSVDRKKALFAFRDSDFHTWSEVLTSDRGWVIFDTVPEVEEAAPRVPGAAKVTALNVNDYHNFSDLDIPGRTTRPWIESGLDRIIEFLSLNFITVLFIAVILIGIALWIQITKKRRLPGDRSSARIASSEIQIPPYLRELREVGSDKGVPFHRSMTWREFETELSRRIELTPEVSRGISYYYAVQFAGRKRDADLETALENSFRKWKGSPTEPES